ncbi:unnamed protein product [Lactuca saligna]|uniref:Glycine-rich protein n=1 Tax=Lactuca saligna TaxID=75948 RepID=A0AA35Y0V2_LACSI|nr:unnamed protein product [Lactuca saligna]
MSSKTFLLLALALAILFISSEMAAAKDLESNNDSQVEDAKYGDDDRGYNGGGGYNNGGGGYNNGGGRYNNGGGSYNNGGGRCYYNSEFSKLY